jgi:hypothetical protein
LKTPARVKTRPPLALIKNTAATFKRNAFKAFVLMMKNPILGRAKIGAHPSKMGTKQALMMAQTC